MRNISTTIGSVTRIVQVAFSITILACSAFILSKGQWWGHNAFSFALFSSLSGLMLSILMLVVPRFSSVLAERLPSFLDIILSGIWTLFFLSAGGNIGAHGSCSNWWGTGYYYSTLRESYGYFSNNQWVRVDDGWVKSYCAVWNAVTAFCLLNFALFAVSTVLAGLDLHHGKGLVKPRRFRKPVQPVGGPMTRIVPQGKAGGDRPYPLEMMQQPQTMAPQSAMELLMQMPTNDTPPAQPPTQSDWPDMPQTGHAVSPEV